MHPEVAGAGRSAKARLGNADSFVWCAADCPAARRANDTARSNLSARFPPSATAQVGNQRNGRLGSLRYDGTDNFGRHR